ncbi:chaperone protein DnaJ, putative [Theileria equi strain WA]|uniref:Chaperone protein DnaJ, putative n=1 Tax=Theileria equi strain WA TaxID=1537102 RepID=L1LGG0_THEEQ|nr:chaperone protein DnaJ, putative [Theileria equi strain WA]EKX74359.1 chaperone protein DnaJ, putative [Theileria equi strain WA]|eukprot:XP_004833811.1 chaperone protein DnaJ, putative [Theileria equi strain WA]
MGLSTLICHSICGSAATYLLLLNDCIVAKRINKFIRYSLFILIASILLYNEIPSEKDTYYHLLGLPINARHKTILNSYTTFQRQIKAYGGSDKNTAFKRAFEVLSDQESRKLYNSFGDVIVDFKKIEGIQIITITAALSYYVISCILFCLFSRSPRLKIARYVIILYNAIAFSLEVEIRFISAIQLFENIIFLNNLLPFQHIQLLRALPPVVMMISSFVTAGYIVDMDKVNLLLWESALATNRIIMEKMSDVVDAAGDLKSLDSKQTPRTILNEKDKSSDLSNLFDSLGPEQKKKLVELLKSSDKKKGKSKVYEFLKSAAIYLATVLVFRYVIG